MMGKTNPAEATPGSIRGDFGQFTGRNIIHGSDGLDTAKFEINLWFKSEEISKYIRIDDKWLTE
jgi:nucleoside-diphosphate kinase